MPLPILSSSPDVLQRGRWSLTPKKEEKCQKYEPVLQTAVGPTHACYVSTHPTRSKTCFHMSKPLLLRFHRSHIAFLSFHLPPPCFLSVSTPPTHFPASSCWWHGDGVDNPNAEIPQSLPAPLPSLFPALHISIYIDDIL